MLNLRDIFQQSGGRSTSGSSPPAPLAKQLFDELWRRGWVIGVARRQPKGQYLSTVVLNQVQFETVEPADRVLTPLSRLCKDTMRGNPPVMTDSERH